MSDVDKLLDVGNVRIFIRGHQSGMKPKCHTFSDATIRVEEGFVKIATDNADYAWNCNHVVSFDIEYVPEEADETR